MVTDQTLVDLVGEVAMREFDASPDWSREANEAWARKLSTLSDAALREESASAIYQSALMMSYRGNHENVHFRCSAVYHEACRRMEAAGHRRFCGGPSIYSAAHALVMREEGHQPSPTYPCDCLS